MSVQTVTEVKCRLCGGSATNPHVIMDDTEAIVDACFSKVHEPLTLTDPTYKKWWSSGFARTARTFEKLRGGKE